MTTTNPSQAYFNQVADQWDSLRSGYFREAVREAAIAKACLHADMTVADVGSGTGFMAAGLAPLVRQVIALDGSTAMLDVARKNLSQFENVRFQEADGLTLPLPDGSVDAVFANMYLHHCPDPLAAIREMQRILRPGGRLVITDLDTHSHAWMKTEMADVWLGFERKQVLEWYREAGLVNRLVDCTGQSCCAESKDAALGNSTERAAQISVFVAVGSKPVRGAREAVQANYGAAASQGTSCCTPQPAQPAASSCCGGAAPEEHVIFQTGYSAGQIQVVPEEAADLALGCGNPTALAGLKPGERVLDIGSGAGMDSFLAARAVGPQGKVIGVDMTPQMIERARRAAARGDYPQVEFRLGQAEDMPVEDGSVDVVLSNCVINLCEDKGRVFQEAYRVLAEGGRLEVSDMVTSGTMNLAQMTNPEQWAGCVSGALPEREYIDLIAQAGFSQIRVRRSASAGKAGGVEVYSVQVSARKNRWSSGQCEEAEANSGFGK